jgi:hypothetical protein
LNADRCDFCHAPHPTWDYPADEFNFEVGATTFHMIPGWYACDACHVDITADDWQPISDRLHARWDLPPAQEAASREFIANLHLAFQVYRTGGPTPINEGAPS